MATTTTNLGLHLYDTDTKSAEDWAKEQNFDYQDDTKKSNAQKIDEWAGQVEESLGSKATSATYTVITSSEWVGAEAPYSQTIEIEGIFETDNPIADVVLSSDYAVVTEQETAWLKIQRIVTNNGSITIYAKEAISTVLTIQLKVVR